MARLSKIFNIVNDNTKLINENNKSTIQYLANELVESYLMFESNKPYNKNIDSMLFEEALKYNSLEEAIVFLKSIETTILNESGGFISKLGAGFKSATEWAGKKIGNIINKIKDWWNGPIKSSFQKFASEIKPLHTKLKTSGLKESLNYGDTTLLEAATFDNDIDKLIQSAEEFFKDKDEKDDKEKKKALLEFKEKLEAFRKLPNYSDIDGTKFVTFINRFLGSIVENLRLAEKIILEFTTHIEKMMTLPIDDESSITAMNSFIEYELKKLTMFKDDFSITIKEIEQSSGTSETEKDTSSGTSETEKDTSTTIEVPAKITRLVGLLAKQSKVGKAATGSPQKRLAAYRLVKNGSISILYMGKASDDISTPVVIYNKPKGQVYFNLTNTIISSQLELKVIVDILNGMKANETFEINTNLTGVSQTGTTLTLKVNGRPYKIKSNQIFILGVGTKNTQPLKIKKTTPDFETLITSSENENPEDDLKDVFDDTTLEKIDTTTDPTNIEKIAETRLTTLYDDEYKFLSKYFQIDSSTDFMNPKTFTDKVADTLKKPIINLDNYDNFLGNLITYVDILEDIYGTEFTSMQPKLYFGLETIIKHSVDGIFNYIETDDTQYLSLVKRDILPAFKDFTTYLNSKGIDIAFNSTVWDNFLKGVTVASEDEIIETDVEEDEIIETDGKKWMSTVLNGITVSEFVEKKLGVKNTNIWSHFYAFAAKKGYDLPDILLSTDDKSDHSPLTHNEYIAYGIELQNILGSAAQKLANNKIDSQIYTQDALNRFLIDAQQAANELSKNMYRYAVDLADKKPIIPADKKPVTLSPIEQDLIPKLKTEEAKTLKTEIDTLSKTDLEKILTKLL